MYIYVLLTFLLVGPGSNRLAPFLPTHEAKYTCL